jgi:Rhodopirellula transposase DDE domain
LLDEIESTKMIDVAAIRMRYEGVSLHLNERSRRLFAANEAQTAGRGGLAAVYEATGIARSTIGRGLSDLRNAHGPLIGRIRRPGGGRKPKTETEAGLVEALGDLVQSAIRGNPEAALLWVSKSQRHLVRALADRGYTASQKLVGRLLRDLGFSLQANKKTLEGARHPDRDAQFEHINQKIKDFQSTSQPAISVDTKKKELVGDFKNGGRELRPKGRPQAVRVHDFQIPELGKVAPYGVYDLAANTGWVNLGIDHDTAAFAVESVRRWWRALGQKRYLGATSLLITADCGGSNGARVRLWKRELFITQNWRAKPLVSHQVIIQLIGSTKTRTGLNVHCCLDENKYPKGIKVSDTEMASINLEHDSFHGEWNYTISPISAEHSSMQPSPSLPKNGPGLAKDIDDRRS